MIDCLGKHLGKGTETTIKLMDAQLVESMLEDRPEVTTDQFFRIETEEQSFGNAIETSVIASHDS